LRAGDVLNQRCDLIPEVEEEIQEPAIDPTVCPACAEPGATRSLHATQIAAITILAAAVGVGIRRTQEAFLLALILLLVALMSDRWRCESCSASWK
jgi:hypothetical protein